MPDGPKVFLSYAHADKETAIALATELRAKGVDVWMDTFEIRPGDSLVQKVFSEGIGRAQYFLVLLSKASTASKWVREELDAGVVRRIDGVTRLIPVLIEPVDVPVPLRALRWVDLSGDRDVGTRELLKVLHGVWDKPALGPPPDFVTQLTDSVGGLSRQASTVGRALLIRPEDDTGFERYFAASELRLLVSVLTDQELNDAVDELESSGLVTTIKAMGTAPYDFSEVAPTYALFQHFKNAGLPYDPDEDICAIASALVAKGELTGPGLHELVKLPPARINRAVAYLDAYHYADVIRTFGTAPFDFNTLTASRRTRRFVADHCR